MGKDISLYLERLNIRNTEDYSPFELIKKIHYNHSLIIPFENLDIISGKYPSLIYNDLFDKIVIQKRGGYCYELNGLLYHILQSLNYKVSLLSSRILFGATKIYFRGHQFIKLEYNNELYILDVGYRNGLLMIIPFILNTEFVQESEIFKFLYIDEAYFLQKMVLNKWENLYSFTSDPYLPEDFEPHHFYNAHSSSSIFTNTRIVSLKTIYGSYSLIDNEIIEIKNGEKIRTKISSKHEYQDILFNTFHINIRDTEMNTIYCW